MKFNTQLLHGNAIKRYPDGATLPPISQVSAFAYETAQDLEKVFNNRAPGYAYTRISNPVVDSFERNYLGFFNTVRFLFLRFLSGKKHRQ